MPIPGYDSINRPAVKDAMHSDAAEVRKEVAKIEKDLRAAMMDMLTPEQKAEIRKAAKKPAK